ncbi:uncharacterized protein LOC134272095 [Saccostrea cucullata]|uniref:uncharacterized protein LOC134272095 n=1 Tax=Saccostrea cuccullata TaxID=36930 RepID=UPI002ED238BC
MSNIEKGDFDKEEEYAGVFDFDKNIGHNSAMKREVSLLTPIGGAIGMFGHALQNASRKVPYYTRMGTVGIGKACLIMFLLESWRTWNYKRYTRRHKFVELYYDEHKEDFPHIGPGPKKYGETLYDWNCSRF